MPVSPVMGENVGVYIARIYADAENDVMRLLADRLRRGVPGAANVDAWAARKLRDLRDVQREVDTKIIGRLGRIVPPEVDERLTEIYRRGQGSAVADLRRVLDEDRIAVTQGFTRANRRAVQSLASATVEKLDGAHFQILRSVTDQYRTIIAETVHGVSTGVATRREASQAALNRFANRGVTGFVDRGGRRWNLQSYTEMAIRSASGQAALQGATDRLQENDRDLVVISDHAESCPLCRPWQGRVCSLSGTNRLFPPLSAATADGLFHPNCAHSLGAYIHGLTERSKPLDDPEQYEDRQQQRYFERGIRKWKRRESASMTPGAEQFAHTKTREWQGRMRDFIDTTDRRRKYEREQITRAF